MTDRWGEDPVASGAQRFWARARIPVGIVFLLGTGIRQRELLLSGEVFPVLTWMMQMAFWAWLFFLAPAAGPPDLLDVEKMRAHAGRQVLAWSIWLVVGSAWLVAATALYGWDGGGLVVVVLPLAAVVLSLPGYLKAEQVVERGRTAAAERSRRRT